MSYGSLKITETVQCIQTLLSSKPVHDIFYIILISVGFTGFAIFNVSLRVRSGAGTGAVTLSRRQNKFVYM
jgi:hypothetical protein